MCSTMSSFISLAHSLFGKGCGLRAEFPSVIHVCAMSSGILIRRAGSEVNSRCSRSLHSINQRQYTTCSTVMGAAMEALTI